jgi:hypothetical protein
LGDGANQNKFWTDRIVRLLRTSERHRALSYMITMPCGVRSGRIQHSLHVVVVGGISKSHKILPEIAFRFASLCLYQQQR